MNQMFFVILGCLPLGWLTALNVLQWRAPVATSATAADRPKLDIAAVAARAAAPLQLAQAELPFVKNLIALEPYSDSLLKIDVATAPPRYQGLAKSWQEFSIAHSEIGKLAKLYQTRLPSDTEVMRLEGYLGSNSLGKVSGGDSVLQWCQERKLQLTEAKAMASRLEGVRSQYDLKQYDKVVSAVKALDSGLLSPAEQAEMEKLRLKSEFAIYWKKGSWVDGPIDPAGLRSRVSKLDDLLKNSPDPVDQEDTDTIARRRSERLTFQRQIVIEELFESNPELFDLAEKCSQILDEDPGARGKLLAGWKKWSESRLSEKVSPHYHTDLREAWEKGGRYRRGMFQASTKVDPVNGIRYYFWAEPKNRSTKTHDTEITQKSLEAEPAEMLEIRVCRQYNAKLAELLKKPDVLRSWEGFSQTCDQLQKETSEYYTRMSTEQRPVTFEAEAKLARDVVAHWPQLGKLFK